MPSLLAMRTTMQMLQGVTKMTAVQPPVVNMKAYLMRVEDTKNTTEKTDKTDKSDRKEKKKKGAHPHYLLAVWSDNTSTGVTVKSDASRVTVTDLWGNAMEISPIDGVAMYGVDEFPRFIDLGESSNVELYVPFVTFDPARIVLHDDSENKFSLIIHHDNRLFHGQLSLDVNFLRWPAAETEDETIKTQKVTLNPMNHYTIDSRLSIPPNLPKVRKDEN